MKTLIRNIVCAISTTLFVSCSSWLEEEPKTFISPEAFYQTVEDFDGALKGLYPQGLNMNLTEVFADYNDKPESAEQVGDIWANNPGYGFYAVRDAWSGAYSTIKNANMILESIEGKDFSEETRNRIIGEAKCLRAWSYFTLVQLFGDVPLRDKVVTSDADIAIERTPEKDIYDFILNDIEEAEQLLPEEAQSMGRVDKYVAKAIMARIYLTSAGFPMNYTENYAKAKEKALEVINSGKYALMPTYDKVFQTEQYTAETIWAQLFVAPDNYSGMHTNSAPVGSQTALYLPTDAFIASFEEGDMRKEWGIRSGYVNARGTEVISRTYYNKYINEEYLEQELPASNTNILTWQTQIIRLAEMYLIAAEAENEMNGPADAYQYINTIRRRARVEPDNPTNVPDLNGLTKEEFREAVLLERQHEFYEEGFAWYDMKRTQTFYKVQEARGDRLNVPIGTYNNTWPIPDTEILNNNIPQNPDYR